MEKFDFEERMRALLYNGDFSEDTIKVVLEEFSKQSDTTAASVWLLDKEENIRLYAACGEKSSGLSAVVLRKGEGICGTCVQNNEIILSEDVTKNKEWTNVAYKKTGFVTKSILSVPISGMNKGAFGCLQILNKQCGNFNESDKETAQAVAGMLAEWFMKKEAELFK